MLRLLVLSSVFLSARSHSWIFSPVPRGGIVGTDLELQRYYCPFDSLERCQPQAKHNITLTPENQYPCRAQSVFDPSLYVVRGRPFKLEWMANGHSNPISEGTCVTISIAPWAANPRRREFSVLEGYECLPFYKEGRVPLTQTMINLNVSVGRYVIFWRWGEFGEFYFSSCTDVEVIDADRESVSLESQGFLTPEYEYMGCQALTNYCKTRFGPFSYCQKFMTDSCGRSWCEGDAKASLFPACPNEGVPQDPFLRPMPPSRGPAAGGRDTSTYAVKGCGDESLEYFCESYYGSYCRLFQTDGCGRSICQGHTQSVLRPCGYSADDNAPGWLGFVLGDISPEDEEDEQTRIQLFEESVEPVDEYSSKENAYFLYGCAKLGSYCGDMFGISSYCREFDMDGCGRSVCQFDTFVSLTVDCPEMPSKPLTFSNISSPFLPFSTTPLSPSPPASTAPQSTFNILKEFLSSLWKSSSSPTPAIVTTTQPPTTSTFSLRSSSNAKLETQRGMEEATGEESDEDFYRTYGCAETSSFCRIYKNSYCRLYQRDSCHRAICQGDTHSDLDSCLGARRGNRRLEGASLTGKMSASANMEQHMRHGMSGLTERDSMYARKGCGTEELDHQFCRERLGKESGYCRYFQVDSCGRSICQGDTYSSLFQPCNEGEI